MQLTLFVFDCWDHIFMKGDSFINQKMEIYSQTGKNWAIWYREGLKLAYVVK